MLVTAHLLVVFVVVAYLRVQRWAQRYQNLVPHSRALSRLHGFGSMTEAVPSAQRISCAPRRWAMPCGEHHDART